MLCCVPKRLADGGPFHDHQASTRPPPVREIRIELYPEEDAPPPILLPCAICARTFLPQSLEKHARICERAAVKRRKPFDSAKQRIRGTELAEFLPKQNARRHQDDRIGHAGRSSWKKNHDDFLQAIREARGEITNSHKQCSSLISPGAPTRANEKGACPTCNRYFGIKAYDRHVAWCKERVARMPASPATNLAKERLEARMRYRAPTLKNRRAANREKYSPGYAASQSAKATSSSPALVKPKENVSASSCHRRNSPVKQKLAVVRSCPGQLKGSPIPSGPMKSRIADRTSRPAENRDSPPTTSSCRSSHLAVSSHRPPCSPVPLLRTRTGDPISSGEIASLNSTRRRADRNETILQRAQNEEARNREVACLTRTPKNIVSARSRGRPRVNDVAVNDEILGVTVQPCKIHKDPRTDDQLATWKRTGRKKDGPLQVVTADSCDVDRDSSRWYQPLDRRDREREIAAFVDEDRMRGGSSLTRSEVTRVEDNSRDGEIDKVNIADDDNDDSGITWLGGIQSLNQTYSTRDLTEIDSPKIFCGKRNRPIKHSPRVEFYFKNSTREGEIREQSGPKFGGDAKFAETIGEELGAAKRRMEGQKINNEDEDSTSIDNEDEDEEAEVLGHKVGKLETDSNYEEDDRKVSVSKREMKEAKLNDGKIDIGRTNDAETMESNERNERDEENKQMAVNSDVTENLVGLNLKPFDSRRDSTFRPNAEDRSVSDDETAPREDDTRRDDSSNSQEVTMTVIFDRFCKSGETSFNDCETGRSSNPKDEAPCRSSVRRGSVDARKNVKTPCAVHEADSPGRDSEEAVEAGTDEGGHENGLIALREESEENSEESSSAVPRDSRIVADNYLSARASNALPRNEADGQLREEGFTSDDSEDSETNRDGERTDFNIDDDLNSRTRLLTRSIDGAEGTACETCSKKRRNINSEVDSARGEDLRSSGALRDGQPEEARRRREKTFPDDVSAKPPRRVSGSIRRATREHSEANVGTKRRVLGESTNFPRSSTDSLVSSVEFVELASVRRLQTDRATCERETVTVIRPNGRNKMFTVLPDIRDESTRARDNCEDLVGRSYWERASEISRSRLIDLDPSARHVAHRPAKRNPRVLPPVPSSAQLVNRRKIELPTRPAWCNYVRRRPDFNLVLKARTGTCKDYDPFLLAEQQMKDLLSDTSDQSVTDSPKTQIRDNGLYPLSHSSAFVKYPYRTSALDLGRRSSLIAPPFEFDDLASSFSSDSTETNSISREIFLKDLGGTKDAADASRGSREPARELGRRLIIDRSKALGSDLVEERRGLVGNVDRPRRSLDGIAASVPSKISRSPIDRSGSVRASSAPRTSSVRDRKISSDARRPASETTDGPRSSDQSLNRRNNNYSSLSGSNLSLSSIISSEMDVKRSNSMFDELLTSFDEDASFPALRSFLNNESFDVSSPVNGDRRRNGLVSDEELSSLDNYKPQDHGKLSNDSAYSSLNRKYSHHGRSTNDVAGRLDEEAPRGEASPQTTGCKMSKFCHECGLRFPESAKFCCECGVKRLTL